MATQGTSPVPRMYFESLGCLYGGCLGRRRRQFGKCRIHFSNRTRFHSFDLIVSRVFCFGGKTESTLTDLYILETGEQYRPWKRPLYAGQLNCRGHASAILHDKLLIFGGARDKKDMREVVIEQKISNKLFFLNVLMNRREMAEIFWIRSAQVSSLARHISLPYSEGWSQLGPLD